MATPGTQYPISEYARLFPDMTQEDYGRLVASIGENGLLEPVAVWRGEVLAAALHLQAAPDFRPETTLDRYSKMRNNGNYRTLYPRANMALHPPARVSQTSTNHFLPTVATGLTKPHQRR